LIFSLKKRFSHNATMIQESSLALGYIIFFSFPVFYLFNSYIVEPTPYESFVLRLIICLIGIYLILCNKLPPSLQFSSPLFLNTVLAFSFPFFFSFMFFKNNGSSIWQINELVALVILTFFTEWLTFIIMSLISITAAAFFYFILTPNPIFPDNMLAVFGSYSAPIVYFIVFRDQRERIYFRQLKTALALSSSIAHEMRTPLSTTQAIAKNIENLTHEYEQGTRPLSTTDKQFLKQAAHDLKGLTARSNLVINMTLANLKGEAQASRERHSIKTCVEQSIKQYPFLAEEQQVIHLDLINDFEFQGDRNMIQHILFNLLANSLYFIKAEQKGEIFISLEQQQKWNILRFKDTAKGIAARDIPHLFEHFFSKRPHGTGVGLAFCRQVMEALGGKITCESVEGEYATFSLYFPKTRSSQ
jgi:signal transduction histidine kinase